MQFTAYQTVSAFCCSQSNIAPHANVSFTKANGKSKVKRICGGKGLVLRVGYNNNNYYYINYKQICNNPPKKHHDGIATRLASAEYFIKKCNCISTFIFKILWVFILCVLF